MAAVMKWRCSSSAAAAARAPVGHVRREVRVLLLEVRVVVVHVVVMLQVVLQRIKVVRGMLSGILKLLSGGDDDDVEGHPRQGDE